MVATIACYEIVERPVHVRRHRGLIFATTGSIVICYMSPIVYWSIENGECFHLTAISLSIIAGGTLFATGFPERYMPGRFDLIGTSHQWMHLFALIANLVEWSFVINVCDQ